jgi:hypothetical protein
MIKTIVKTMIKTMTIERIWSQQPHATEACALPGVGCKPTTGKSRLLSPLVEIKRTEELGFSTTLIAERHIQGRGKVWQCQQPLAPPILLSGL